MQNKGKTVLDDIPASSNKEFWDEAEVNVIPYTNASTREGRENIEREVSQNRDKHNFVRKSGHEAQCTHCDWGFVLDAGDKIVDGHLIDRKGNLVI